jgi:hypothetical protein
MAPVGPETTHDDRSAWPAPDLAASGQGGVCQGHSRPLARDAEIVYYWHLVVASRGRHLMRRDPVGAQHQPHHSTRERARGKGRIRAR